MTLEEIARVLEARPVGRTEGLGGEIRMAFASDLMSDVLSFSKTGSLLLTGLTHVQVVRTAEMADLAAVCFVWGKQPPPDTVHLAESGGIPLLVSPLSMYEACGRLYREELSDCHART